MPRPSRGFGVLYYLLRLLELEVGCLGRAIFGGYRHVVAGARARRRLPVVDELACWAVVTEGCVTCRHQLDIVEWRAGVAGDLRSLQRLLDVGRIGQFGGAREELELDRHGGATLDRVNGGAHIHGLVEALEGPRTDDQGARLLALVVVVGDLSQYVVAANVGRVSDRVATLAVGDLHAQARRAGRGCGGLGRTIVEVGSEAAQLNRGRSLVDDDIDGAALRVVVSRS